ncbi:UNVERIFIED_CONTAM: hypothetical protein NCL1_03939 [Trichonephila clavipes]
MEKGHLLTIAISDYRTSAENVELGPPVQYNASPVDNSRTTLTVSFRDVTGMKQNPDIYQRYLPIKVSDMKNYSLWVRPAGYGVSYKGRPLYPDKFAFGRKIDGK